MPEIYVISDQHFEDEQPSAVRIFLSLCEHLERQAGQVERLMILGDFFQYWVSRRSLIVQRYQSLLDGLHRLSRVGIRIDFFLGNHDFLFRSHPDLPDTLVIHPHGRTLDFGQSRYYVTHGDDLCRTDYGYRLLKPILRHPFFEWVVACLSDRMVDQIATRMHRTSDRIVRKKSDATLKITPAYLRRLIRETKAEGIVHGHFHTNGRTTLDVDGIEATRISVGPWENGRYPVWIFNTDDNQWRTENWQPDSGRPITTGGSC